MEVEKGTQLKEYIKREVKENKIHSNYGYTYYFCRSFLESLYAEEPEKYILKGSFSQFANTGKLIRPLTDIDIAVDSDIEDANYKVCNLSSLNRKITYKIQQSFITKNATINYRIMCGFDNIQHLITLDLRKQTEIDKAKKDLPKLFSKDNSFPTNTITLEEHLATKIYITLLGLHLNIKLGKEFRRFKDFYDIHGLLAQGNIDENKLSYLLENKIKNNDFLNEYSMKGNLFTKNFITENNSIWENESKKYGFLDNISLEETVESTNDYISRMK